MAVAVLAGCATSSPSSTTTAAPVDRADWVHHEESLLRADAPATRAVRTAAMGGLVADGTDLYPMLVARSKLGTAVRDTVPIEVVAAALADGEVRDATSSVFERAGTDGAVRAASPGAGILHPDRQLVEVVVVPGEGSPPVRTASDGRRADWATQHRPDTLSMTPLAIVDRFEDLRSRTDLVVTTASTSTDVPAATTYVLRSRSSADVMEIAIDDGRVVAIGDQAVVPGGDPLIEVVAVDSVGRALSAAPVVDLTLAEVSVDALEEYVLGL